MKPGKRQYTLITLTFTVVMLAAIGCGLPVLSIQTSSRSIPNGETLPQTATNLYLTEDDLPQPAWLGIIGATVRPEMAQAMNLPAGQTGILVHLVESHSPAQQANIRGSEQYITAGEHRWLVGGDIITTFNNIPINTMQDLHNLLTQAQPGEEITVTVLRDGQESNLKIKLATYPNLDLTGPANGLQTT